jgi:hypothetical protein
MKTFDDREQIVTKILPYEDCMNYVRAHQKELTVYKTAYTPDKKNAKRKQLGRILADSKDLAIKLFRGMTSSLTEKGLYQLFTGDWKEIYSITKEGN